MAPWSSHLETPLNSLLSMTMLEVSDRISLGLYSLQSLPHSGGKLEVQGFIIVTYLFKLETVNGFLSSNLWFLVMKWFLAADVFFFFFYNFTHITYPKFVSRCSSHVTYPKFVSRCSSKISLFYCFLPTCFSLNWDHLFRVGSQYIHFTDFNLGLFYSFDTFYWIFFVQLFKNTIINCSQSISS